MAKAPEKAPVPAEDAIEPAKAKRPPFYVCDGKSITTKKGILGPGDEIKAEYLADGDAGIKRHRENGVIAKG